MPEESYYPGSKTPKKQYPGGKARLHDIELPEPFRVYRVKGVLVDMFTIGQLAALLGRKAVSLRRWEAEGTIPLAPFTAPSDDPRGRRRLFSEAHVVGILKIAAEEGLLDDLTIKISETKFRPRVLELFKELAAA